MKEGKAASFLSSLCGLLWALVSLLKAVSVTKLISGSKRRKAKPPASDCTDFEDFTRVLPPLKVHALTRFYFRITERTNGRSRGRQAFTESSEASSILRTSKPPSRTDSSKTDALISGSNKTLRIQTLGFPDQTRKSTHSKDGQQDHDKDHGWCQTWKITNLHFLRRLLTLIRKT